MNPIFLCLSASCAFLAVAFGAFGAHGLKTVLSTEMLLVYKTAVNYHMWHAMGLSIIAFLSDQYPGNKWIIYAGWLMFSGIILFSGSLYLLSLSGYKWLGAITPIGGLCFLSAWLLLVIFSIEVLKKK